MPCGAGGAGKALAVAMPLGAAKADLTAATCGHAVRQLREQSQRVGAGQRIVERVEVIERAEGRGAVEIETAYAKPPGREDRQRRRCRKSAALIGHQPALDRPARIIFEEQIGIGADRAR